MSGILYPISYAAAASAVKKEVKFIYLEELPSGQKVRTLTQRVENNFVKNIESILTCNGRLRPDFTKYHGTVSLLNALQLSSVTVFDIKQKLTNFRLDSCQWWTWTS